MPTEGGVQHPIAAPGSDITKGIGWYPGKDIEATEPMKWDGEVWGHIGSRRAIVVVVMHDADTEDRDEWWWRVGSEGKLIDHGSAPTQMDAYLWAARAAETYVRGSPIGDDGFNRG